MLQYAHCCSILFCCGYIICFWWIHSIYLPIFFRVASLAIVHTINPIHKSHNAPVPYPTMHQCLIPQCTISQCTHFCSGWCIVGYGTSALWDLLNLSIAPVSVYILLPQCQRINPEGYGLILPQPQQITQITNHVHISWDIPMIFPHNAVHSWYLAVIFPKVCTKDAQRVMAMGCLLGVQSQFVSILLHWTYISSLLYHIIMLCIRKPFKNKMVATWIVILWHRLWNIQ